MGSLCVWTMFSSERFGLTPTARPLMWSREGDSTTHRLHRLRHARSLLMTIVGSGSSNYGRRPTRLLSSESRISAPLRTSADGVLEPLFFPEHECCATVSGGRQKRRAARRGVPATPCVSVATGFIERSGRPDRPTARKRPPRRPHPSSASDSTNRTRSACREMECFW